MSGIPSKLIHLKHLADVPVSEYADIRPPKNTEDEKERLSFLKRLRQKPEAKKTVAIVRRTLSFNAAVWLKFSQSVNKPVSLWLSYKDAEGEQTILVDEQALNGSTSAMLSGSVTISVKGAVEYLKACCGGVSNSEKYLVEEVHVRRQELQVQSSQQTPKLRLVS